MHVDCELTPPEIVSLRSVADGLWLLSNKEDVMYSSPYETKDTMNWRVSVLFYHLRDARNANLVSKRRNNKVGPRLKNESRPLKRLFDWNCIMIF